MKRLLTLLLLALFAAPSFAGVSSPGGSGGSSSASLQDAFNNGKEITGADSRANAFCAGAGTNPPCMYEDGTLGPIYRPKTDANARTYIWPGYNWSLYTLGNTRAIIVVEPDGIAANSATITVQTDDQLVGSNLGFEFTESDTNPACASGNYTLYADASEAKIKKCVNGVASVLDPAVYIRKAANETVNNSNSLQNDNELVFAVEANKTYLVKLFLLYDSSTTADFQYSFTLPAGAVGYKTTVNAPTSTTTCSGTSGTLVFNSITQTNNSVGGAGTGTANTCALSLDGTIIVSSTAGNAQFRWAQANLDATDTVVRAGSWISYQLLP